MNFKKRYRPTLSRLRKALSNRNPATIVQQAPEDRVMRRDLALITHPAPFRKPPSLAAEPLVAGFI